MFTFTQINYLDYKQLQQSDTIIQDRIYFITDTKQIFLNNVNFLPQSSQNDLGTVITLDEIPSDYIENNSQYKQVPSISGLIKYITENKTQINGLEKNINIIAGEGITISTSNQNIIVENNEKLNNNQNISLTLDGVDTDNILYILDYPYKIQITHNLGCRCICSYFDNNTGLQQNVSCYYINDNVIEIVTDEISFPSSTETKTLTIQAASSIIQTKNVFYTGKKPLLKNAIEHEEFGIIGKLTPQENEIVFNEYNCNPISKIELWISSESCLSGKVVLEINNNTFVLEINDEITKKTLYFDQPLYGIIKIKRNPSVHTSDDLIDAILVLDWALYYENEQNLQKEIPYIINNPTNKTLINQYNGLHQIVKNINQNLYLTSENIINLSTNQIIKIRFENTDNYEIGINNDYTDSSCFYVQFININGEIKQIGSIIQVE